VKTGNNVLNFLSRFFFYIVLCFPLFYFVYKFGDPDQLAHDFYHYYSLYDHFDLKETKSPFNMRFIGAFFIYLIHQAGIYYDTATHFDGYANYMKEEVWFAALFFNFIMVSLTATIASYIYSHYFSDSKQTNFLNALLVGCIYMLGFGTLFYDLMPLTEAFSTCLFSCMIWLFLRRSYWMIPLMLLCVFQREFNLVLISVVGVFYYHAETKRFSLHIVATAIALLAAYFLIRSTWFYNPELYGQTNINIMLKRITTIGIDPVTMFKQSMMSLNICLLYAVVIISKRYKRIEIDKRWLLIVAFCLLSTLLVTLAGSLGTNFGRVFYLISPVIACLLVKEASAFNTVKEV